MTDPILIHPQEGLVHVRLNRPQVLNALSGEMIDALLPVVLGDAPVLISGEGRAFCAGGDVKAAWHAVKSGALGDAQDYFKREYHMNAALFKREAPYVAFLNGICMGGGYGVSAHGSHIIVCEHTRFAMPEVKIGFFPDVGAAYHLGRLPHNLGKWLGVTGNVIGPDDMLFAGLATGYVPHDDMDVFIRIMEQGGADKAVEVLAQPCAPDGIFRQHYGVIERCFAHDNVADIMAALKADDSDFALETWADMQLRSPLSMQIALTHIDLSANDDFDTVIARDLKLAYGLIQQHDFIEGVRAVLIDKDNDPRFNPAHVGDVTPDMLGIYFNVDGD